MSPADTDESPTPTAESGASVAPKKHAPIDPSIRVDDTLFGEDERLWARYILIGVIAGVIAWAVIMTAVVYALEDEVGLGGAIGAGMVPGIFGGLFFGGCIGGFAYAIRHPEH